MDSVDFGRVLAEERRLRRWTQEDLGTELAKLSTVKGQPRAPVPKPTISIWENNHRCPEPWLAWLLCVLLNKPPDELHLAHIVTPEVAARYERSASTTALPTRLADMLDAGPVRDFERLARAIYGVHPVDAVAVADMQVATDSLFSQRGVISSRLLLVQLHQHLDILRDMMGRAQTPRVRRELTWLAALTAVVAGNTWQWVNDLGAASEVILYARRLAAEAGAGVVSAMADFAYTGVITCGVDLYTGSDQAVEVLDRAERALAGGVDVSFSTILYATRGKLKAALDRESEANRDFEAAHRGLARWQKPASGLFTGIDPTYVVLCQGKAALLTNRPAEAIEHYQGALADSEGWLIPTYQVNLAAAYGQTGQPEQAAALLMQILKDAGDANALLLKWVGGIVRHDLHTFADVPTVRQLQEALTTGSG